MIDPEEESGFGSYPITEDSCVSKVTPPHFYRPIALVRFEVDNKAFNQSYICILSGKLKMYETTQQLADNILWGGDTFETHEYTSFTRIWCCD